MRNNTSRLDLAAQLFAGFVVDIEALEKPTAAQLDSEVQTAITKSINLSNAFHNRAEQEFPADVVTVETTTVHADKEPPKPSGKKLPFKVKE